MFALAQKRYLLAITYNKNFFYPRSAVLPPTGPATTAAPGAGPTTATRVATAYSAHSSQAK